MAVSRPAYRYERLRDARSIRVAELLPGYPGDPMEVRLSQHLLENPDTACDFPYEAISYVWGRSNVRVAIDCERGILRVSTSLYNLLEEFRPLPPSPPWRFWADSICINQSDPYERSEQVMVMRQVYTHAEQVLIWLGPDLNEEAPRAFLLAKSITKACLAVLGIKLTDINNINVRKMLDQAGHEVEKRLPSDPELWSSIAKLFQCSWFQRIWVIQEAHAAGPDGALAIWGREEINFDVINVAACWIDWADVNLGHVKSLDSAMMAGVNRTVIMRGSFINDVPFQTLLHQARLFKASEPKDMVYALIGFSVAQGAAPTIRPDYTPGKSLQEVYQDAFRAILALKDGINVIGYAQHGESVPLDRPSWLSLFAPNRDEYVLVGIKFFNACGPVTSPPAQLHGRTLRVHGLRVDTVASMTSALQCPSRKLSPQDRIIIESVVCTAAWPSKSGSTYTSTNEALVEAYAQTLTAGLRNASYRKHTKRQHLLDFAAFAAQELHLPETAWRRLQDVLAPPAVGFDKLDERDAACGDTAAGTGRDGAGEASVDAAAPTEAARYLLALARTSCFKRFFWTNDGFVGTGPQAMLPGDEVWVLAGAQTPFVLRPVPDEGSDCYRLVGECYTHGIMFGELPSDLGVWERGAKMVNVH